MDGMVSIVEDQYKKLLEKFGSFASMIIYYHLFMYSWS